MLLLTIQEWLGPGKKMNELLREEVEPSIQLVGFATRLSLSDAITHMGKYETAYNDKFALGLTLKIVSVSTIDDLTNELIDIAGMELLEDKPTKKEDFH